MIGVLLAVEPVRGIEGQLIRAFPIFGIDERASLIRGDLGEGVVGPDVLATEID